MKIGIITCAEHWRDGTSQEPDDRLLLAALGQNARGVVWGDPHTDWSAYDLCIVRSTWDYHNSREAFLSWARATAARTALWNPYPVLKWNTDKNYLRDLEQRDVPSIPTIWLPAGTRVDLGLTLSALGWQRAVMKPVAGTNSYGVALLSHKRLEEGQAALDALLKNRATMLQPYYPSVNDYGERSLVFIANELTHAFRKRAAFDDQHPEKAVRPTQNEVQHKTRSSWRGPFSGKPGAVWEEMASRFFCLREVIWCAMSKAFPQQEV